MIEERSRITVGDGFRIGAGFLLFQLFATAVFAGLVILLGHTGWLREFIAESLGR